MTKYLIAIPAMDFCPVAFAYSLATMRRAGASRVSMICGAAVHEARNRLAGEAIQSGADRVLWLDSDMVFDDDLMQRLSEALDDGWDMVCGIFFKRRLPLAPVIYSKIDPESGLAAPYTDYPRDSLFPVAGCGFGAVMTTTALLEEVWAQTRGEPFTPMESLSEDLSFCARAGALGARVGCDSRIKVGHAGMMVYGEQLAATRTR